MTTSLVIACNGIPLFEDPLIGPTVTHMYRGRQPTRFLAQQILTTAASRASSSATKATSDWGPNPEFVDVYEGRAVNALIILAGFTR